MKRAMSYQKILLVFILLSGVSISRTDEGASVGHIHLTLQDIGGSPMVTFPVFLTDTLGTTWNLIGGQRGEYSLTVPEGYYFLTARCLTLETFRTDWIYVNAGDTISLEHRYRFLDLGDDTWDDHRPDTLQLLSISLDADSSACVDGLTLFAWHRYFRENRSSEDSYMVHVDNTCFDLSWNLPHLADRPVRLPFDAMLSGNNPQIELPVGKSRNILLDLIDPDSLTPVILADLTDDEWVSPNYEMHRTLVNPADWGHDDLYKYGYVDGRAYFDRSETGNTWRIVLAFHRRVVVLAEDTEPVVHDLGSSMSRVVFSPTGKCLFFFDATDGLSCREEGILLNTRTGEERRFVPDPNAEPYEWNPSFSSHFSTEPWWTYHPADDGSIVALFRDSIRLYDEQLEVIRTSCLVGMCLGDGHNTGIRQRSPDGDQIAVIDYTDRDCELVLINRDGSVEYSEPVHIGTFRANDAFTVLTSTANLKGMSAWDMSDGSFLWHLDAEQCGGNIVSPGGNLVGWSPGWTACEIRSALTGELLDSFPSGEPQDGIRIGYLGDDGACVICLSVDRTYRFALRASSGELVWLSASRRGFPRTDASSSSISSIWDLLVLSPDGESLIYNDGCFIQILRFNRIRD